MYKNSVVITGASRRLGLYLCQQFQRAGWRVLAVSRKASAELAALVGETVELYEIDSYCDSSAQALAQTIASRHSNLGALVHNASLYQSDSAHSSDSAEFHRALFQVHMAFPAQLNLGLYPLLAAGERAGSIVHISDIYAANPSADHALYCSTKAGMENLSLGHAKKFAPRVRVNAIQPGPIAFLPEHSEQYRARVLSQTLLPDDGGFLPIYQAVGCLVDNAFITGASIRVDGGRSLAGLR